MQPINGWDNIEEAGSFEKIELGGHICVIVDARIEPTRSGNEMLVISYDFAVNDKQPGYFRNLLDQDRKRNPQAKWRESGRIRQGFGTEQSNPFFKRLINRIVESNPGYQWDWNEYGLKGKMFGGVFGHEEYENDKGEIKQAIKCMSVQNLEGIFEAAIPEDKPLSKKEPKATATSATQGNTYLSIDDDDLPF